MYEVSDQTNGKYIGELLNNGKRAVGSRTWESLRGQWVTRTCRVPSEYKFDVVIISEDKYEELKRKCVAYPDAYGLRKFLKQFVSMQPVRNATYMDNGVLHLDTSTQESAFQVGNNIMEHFSFIEAFTSASIKTGRYSDVINKKETDKC